MPFGPAPRSRFSSGLIAGIFLSLALAVFSVWLARKAGDLSLPALFFGSSKLRIDVSQPSVVRQIRGLQRLETVVYAVDKIVEGEQPNRLLPKLLAGDRLLMIVHGEVVAGIDLRNIGPGDVTIAGHSVLLKLPEVELFSTRIDNQKTRVFSRITGLFTTVDPNLESSVRREAETQLQEAAIKDGILAAADKNARATLSMLLKGFGFERVEIRQPVN